MSEKMNIITTIITITMDMMQMRFLNLVDWKQLNLIQSKNLKAS